ncbi:amino acid deaminase [Aquabacterium sp.]|uniref:amino acid deaminase n=1 Tax=Aquabacterium sp. TaxID=1872578 RepID=UPI002C96AC19|nr:amino acid deaminase [Aquabacterium sp.]HSW05031.1 amino acid deaminase [Aquabacterium sp.]
MTDAMPPALSDVLDPLIDAHSKGFPQSSPPLRRSQIGAQGWRVFDGDLPLPLAVIKRDTLQHNLGWMQGFANDRSIGLAPHGKTTMSPQLFQRQLAAGAWGITFATVGQLRIGVAAGVRNALIANQVITAIDLAGITALQAAHPDLRVLFLLDSPAQLALIEGTHPATPFEVLLEVGVPGGRTGCRTHEQAMALARRAHDSAAVRLCGVECYEGLGAINDDVADAAYADALLHRVYEVARQCDRDNLFNSDEIILSAGGSAIFDLVAQQLTPHLKRKVRGLLRSGCYITHDQGSYKRYMASVNRRLGCAADNGLHAALEVWAAVQSLPEPGLAILAVGKRDISHDIEMPLPLGFVTRGSHRMQHAPADWKISALNDQHAYLRFDGASLRVGDLVALGISHPCTTFDKWRWMPIVDGDYRVVDALVTCF